MSPQIILAISFNATLIGTCGYAALKGGRPERVGAGINLLASGVTTALRLMNPAYFAPAEVVTLLIDLFVAAGFFWLGVTTTRFWPIWAAGFAVADLFMSAVGALLPRIPLFAYHTGLGIYAYLALGALALGTFRLPSNAEPFIRTGSRRLWTQYVQEMS